MAKTRYRGQSGSGWQWGVQPRQGDAQSIRLVSGSDRDFDAHSELDIPGWATPAAEITSRYDDALTFFGLEGQSFRADSYQDASEPLDFDDGFPSNVFHFGQARMIRHERLEDMKRHPLITLTDGPSPDNRIRLGSKVDRFGRRLPNLQWSWSQVELDSIERSRDMVAEQFERANAGSYVSVAELGQGPIQRAGSGAHHLGGTRQSESPKDGVVDANNRLHGVSNLTIVGTSVFPTSIGYANPTLTAIADGLRVADHLASVT